MKNIKLIFLLFLMPITGFCQTVGLNKTFYPLEVVSQNDTQNPVLIRADGSNIGLAAMAINTNNTTASSTYGIGRNGSNWASLNYNSSLSTLDIRVGNQSFNVIRVNPANNFVTMNAFNAPTIAQLQVNGTIKLGTNGTALNSISKATVTLDFPTIAASQTGGLAFTVSNAPVGSVVSISPSVALDPRLIIAYAYVQQANILEVYVVNTSSTNAIDPPAMSFYVTVIN